MPCSLLAHVEAARGATTQAAGAALVAEAGGGSGQTDAGGSRVPHVVASSADLDTAEMAAVRKETETKLVAITWLACCLWVRPSVCPRGPARGRVLCGGAANQVEVALSNPNGALDGRTRFGRKGGRARVRRQQEGGQGGWVRMSMRGLRQR